MEAINWYTTLILYIIYIMLIIGWVNIGLVSWDEVKYKMLF